MTDKKPHGLTGKPSNNSGKFKARKRSDTLSIQCFPDDQKKWKQAAKVKGVSKANFVETTLNAEAEKILKDN